MSKKAIRRPALISIITAICLVWFVPLQAANQASRKRDPFFPLISPEGRLMQPVYGQESGDLRLEGIIYDEKGASFAMVNGLVVRPGSVIRGYRVIKIQKQSVIFMKDDNLTEISLQQKKGESVEKQK